MAATTLRQEDLKVLDQTRQRLFQLANNIASLKTDVQQGNPLPPWESIQTAASILSHNINGLVDHFSKSSETLNRTVVYPSTNYPGRTQEAVLGQLLRKKYEPQVETWVDQGRSEAVEDKEDDAEDLWNWAADWIGQRAATYVLEEGGDNYTSEEREAGIENVRTGLRRKLDEDESDEEDEDEDDEMEDAVPDSMKAERTNSSQAEAEIEAVKKSSGTKRTLDDILKASVTGTIISRQ